MPRIHLTTTDGNTFEAELVGDRMSVGRNEGNDLVIPDSSVSGSHGEFSSDGSTWSFTDLGSTNGTKINGEQVERVELGHGAQFQIGDVGVYFMEDEAAPAPASASASPSAARHAPADGYNNRALDRSARVGFGPKKVKKDGSRSALMALGVLGLLVVLGTIGLLVSGGL
jgi:pSer/pThr/pTyr-binding forkhead associated (FHA) protein